MPSSRSLIKFKSAQPVSPGEYCEKWCQTFYQCLNNQHPQTFPHPLSRSPAIGVDQVGQSGPAAHKPLLAGPDPWLFIICHIMALKTTFSMTFPGTEVRLTGLETPEFSF